MIRTFFTVIGALKALNISCGKIEFDKERLDYYLLKEQSQSARAIYKLEHIDPELFFIELQCTVVSLEKYDHALAIFISEIKKYIEWFNIHREEVAKFTTDYAIRDSADKIVCREEGIHSRYKSFEKTVNAILDERQYARELVNAYKETGKVGYGYNLLTEEEKQLISEPLSEYKKHYGVDEVNLMEVYKNFSEGKEYEHYIHVETEYQDLRLKRYDILQSYIKEIEEDLHTAVTAILWKYLDYIQESYKTNPPTVEEIVKVNPGRKPLGVYNSFRDMFLNEDAFIIIDRYIRKKGLLNTGEAVSIFEAINKPNDKIIKESRISKTHYGQLLIGEYGSICTFTQGKSVVDGKVYDDIVNEIRAMLKNQMPQKTDKPF